MLRYQQSRPLLVALISMLMIIGAVSCAGSGPEVAGDASITPRLEQTGSATKEAFSLLDSELDTSPGLGLERVNSDDGVTIRVVAETARETGLLMFCLEYDAASYHLAETVAGELPGTKDCLTLTAAPRPGYVCFGQVRQGGGAFAIEPGGLVAEVRFQAGAETASRGVSGAPTCDQARTPLDYTSATARLEFYLVNPGDYDQNGLVTVSDLAPIGQHYGKAGPFNYSSALSVVDGNQNGMIEIGDITSIGQNWANEVEKYYIFRGEDPADYPANNGDPSTINPCKSMDLAEASGIAATDRLWFSYQIVGPTGGESYWVRPVAVTAGDVSEGTPSEMITSSCWLMSGHDAQHTNRTNAIGPQTGELAWRYIFGAAGSTYPAFGSDGTVYVGSDQRKLYAVDPDDGEIKWFYQAEDDELTMPVVGADGTVYFCTRAGNLYAVNPDGGLEWSYETDGQILAAPVLDGAGVIYVGNREGDLCAVDPSGDLLWKHSVDYIRYRPVVGADGRIYVLSEDETVNAITNTGELVWQLPVSGTYIRTDIYQTIGGGLVFGVDDRLQCVTPEGEESWSYNLGVDSFTEPVLLPDGAILVSTEDNRLLAISQSGNLQWTYTSAQPYSQIAVDTDRERIYAFAASSADAFDFSGNLIVAGWLEDVAVGLPVVDAAGNVVLASTTDGLRCFSSGAVAKWDIPPCHGPEHILVTADGTLYCAGRCVSLSEETYWLKSFSPDGDLLWTYDLPAGYGGCPAIDRWDVLYCACDNRELMALTLDGELIWSIPMEIAAVTDLVVSADRIIYAGCEIIYISGYDSDGEQVLWASSCSFVSEDASPTVAKDETLYYFVWDGNLMSRVLPYYGVQWITDYAGNLEYSAVINSDGNIYYGSSSVYAINVDGWTMWSVDLNNTSLTCGMSLTSDDTLLCCCDDGYLRSIDYRGNELTERALEVDCSHSPVIDGNGTVYVEDQETILAVDLETGEVLWSDRPGGVCTTDLVIGPEGQLYLGGDDSVLYAYRGPE